MKYQDQEFLRTSAMLAGGLLVISLSGCGSKELEPGAIAQQWATNTSQLGINPIYPMREKLLPGDIYVVATIKIEDEKLRGKPIPAAFYTLQPVKFSQLDYCKLFKKHGKRPSAEPTTDYTFNNQKTSPWEAPAFNYSKFDCAGYAGKDFAINEAAAFPAFSFASLSKSGLGANVTNGSWGALFGFGKKADYYLTYTVPNPELISVDGETINETLNEFRRNISSDNRSYIAGVASSMQAGIEGYSVSAAIAVIRDVYYTRALDVSTSKSDSSSASLSATTMAMVELTQKQTKLQEQLKSLKASPATPGTPAAAAQQSKISELEKSIAAASSEVEALAKLSVPTAPGVTGSITNVSSTGITMTQVFPKPVAIGYRADLIKLDEFLRRDAPLVNLPQDTVTVPLAAPAAVLE